MDKSEDIVTNTSTNDQNNIQDLVSQTNQETDVQNSVVDTSTLKSANLDLSERLLKRRKLIGHKDTNENEIKSDSQSEKQKVLEIAMTDKTKNNAKATSGLQNIVKNKVNYEEESKPPVKDPEFVFLNPHSIDKQNRRKRSCPSQNNVPNTISTIPNESIAVEVPIFTAEFLEHNKNIDMELRSLRKSKSDLEQHNAVLEKHVENMKLGVQKLTSENDEIEEKNQHLETYLIKLKRKLANALSDLAIPTEPNGATYENIVKYMEDLYRMATSNTHGPACLNKARDIIRKLDLQIQL